jgi:uncharacterized repeat protein (TIGR03803 family)
MKPPIHKSVLPAALITALALMLAGRLTAQTLTTLYTFNHSGDGTQPFASLILANGTLYGTTLYGGAWGYGTVFGVPTTVSPGFVQPLYSFTGGSDEANPYGRLVLSADTLYGTTRNNASGYGTVFAVPIAGSATLLAPLHSFDGSDGAAPYDTLILSGSTLYGTAYAGGTYDAGTVFSVMTDGSLFTTLWNFSFVSEGLDPEGGLILSGTTLYGTTDFGGAPSYGTVFSINTDGSGFTSLHSFNGSDGAHPFNSLILSLSGTTLYGTTQNGGSSATSTFPGYGTVFSINTDGSGFTTLYNFTGDGDGAYPFDTLVLSGSTLYGTTEVGGAGGFGTVFAVPTTATPSGTVLPPLHIFTGGSDGSDPFGGLVLSGTTLYGTTAGAGGTVFSLSLTPGTLTVTPNAVSTTYNGTALGDTNYSDNTGNYSITGFQNGDTISSAGVTLSGSMDFNGSTATTVENVGSYALTVGTLTLSSANGNYVMSFSNPSLNAYVITPATLTVTANSLTKTYGSADPTLTYSVNGLQGSDTESTVLTGSLARAPGEDVGTYAINQGTLAANANYTIIFVPGTLTVTEVPLTITWPANIVISTGGACSTANLPPLNIGTPTYTPSIPDVTVTLTRSDGQSQTAPYPVGITTITWTVTDVDDGGYSATYNQTVEVTDDVSISGNFNGTRIPAGSTIWFTAVLMPKLPRNVSGPVTIWFFAQNITSSAFNLAVPNATVVFDPQASLASATCDSSGRWTTRAPWSGLAGNTLLATYAYQLPPGQSLPRGLQPVTWDGTFATDTPGVTLQWQWSAAVYTQFGNCSSAGVKCTDDTEGDCNYQNSDHAGTPENYKLYVIGGGHGGGGSDCTGSLSSTKKVVPCVEASAP